MIAIPTLHNLSAILNMSISQQIHSYAVAMNLLMVAGVVSVGVGWPATAIGLLFAASLFGVKLQRLRKANVE